MSNAASPSNPVAIPTPPDFPVTWKNPDDQRAFWNQDRTHAPHPLPPFEMDFWMTAYAQIDRAGADYGFPVSIRGQIFNQFLYMTVGPKVPPDQMGQAMQAFEKSFDAAMGNLQSLWDNEWLPEIKSHLDWWAAFDLQGASLPDLMAHARETWERAARLFHVHFLIVTPAYIAISQYDELYHDLFSEDSTFDSFKPLQGFDNKTVEAARELWLLSRKANADPDIADAVKLHSASEVMEALGRTANGRAFRDEFRAFLQVYGQRGDTWGPSHRSWIEDPTSALKNLRDYLSQPDLDFDATHNALRAGSEEAVAEATERLMAYPAAVRERFAFMLKAAQIGYILSEDHGFWIDFAGLYRVRCVFMEVGRRLADAGIIATADDVFFLTRDEALDAERLISEGVSCQPQVVNRKAELERLSHINAPPVLGTDYGPPPDDMIGRFLMKFFGGPPPASDVPGEIRGHAGSPGKVRGRARIIQSLEEADRLERGEILVTPSTAPPWTPLFATAGGIVTDAGGILSHCAVVAREYRIPAVVGTGVGTALIPDGQLIEVDGDAGTIRFVGV